MKTKKVTGGGNGLGRGICFELAKHGCIVAVADINLQAAEETASEIRSRGVRAKAYKIDVTKSDEALKLRDDLRNDLGPVDILVGFCFTMNLAAFIARYISNKIINMIFVHDIFSFKR